MNPELEARLWSLEAERLRPVPPKPPTTGMDRRAIERVIDSLVALGLDDEDEAPDSDQDVHDGPRENPQ
ncbi:hypothetical protein FXF51_05840 [Nonomuraea sp. PA05]|uniref:hypothetical protein n=1 Tax=Nonomuraea sp. PA05 TaxID=2604466 RepID=UPI0011D9615E|nr:hypothetical protein [Nonomuraea sp. PA05]TYB69681.1 hypothetical protein FXF51_05840 [Nonomuraea sp. PA05]